MTDTTVRPPAPRLQLRWEKSEEPDTWLCHYELILPLRAIDIRREQYAEDGKTVIDSDELPLHIESVSSLRSSEPCASGDFAAPYRSGEHAKWDAEALSGLPVYCVSPSGQYIRDPLAPQI